MSVTGHFLYISAEVPLVSAERPTSGGHLLTSAECLAQLEEKQRQKQLATEQKEQRKSTRESKESKRKSRKG